MDCHTRRITAISRAFGRVRVQRSRVGVLQRKCTGWQNQPQNLTWTRPFKMYSILDLRPRNTKVTNEESVEDLISKHAPLLKSLYSYHYNYSYNYNNYYYYCFILEKKVISTFSHVSIISINPLELQVLIHLSA